MTSPPRPTAPWTPSYTAAGRTGGRRRARGDGLGGPAPDRVRVLGTAGSAGVELRTGGDLAPHRLVADGYADLTARGASADAVRLTWASGSPAPSVAEVVFVPRV